MLILGIETSCDDTSVALVKSGSRVVEQITSSQVKIHSRFSGVVPELASREHLSNINWMIEKILKSVPKGGRIDAVAVTAGPGLVGSLLVGYMTAEVLSYILDVPLIEVNHLEGHIFSAFLNRSKPDFPFVSMVVSGGHTDLVLVSGWGKYKVLGRTRDDACGEAYDKVAKLMGLGYPGGPIVDRLYYKGDPGRFVFPKDVIPGKMDFSFSGLKTAVLYKVRELTKNKRALSLSEKEDIAASFQEAAVSILIKKLVVAVKSAGTKTAVLGGGVTANSLLRSRLKQTSEDIGFKVYLPEFSYCVDNAAMIASVAYYKYKNREKKKKPLQKCGVNSSDWINSWPTL